MKKFLFTLVAFLMAGSMFADNYFYVEDFEVTPEFLAQESGKARQLDVAVYAHFDDMVSGWQTNMTLPEGVTVRNAEAAEGMTIHGLNALGNPKDYNVALSSNLETQRFIGASTEAGYYYPEGADPDEDDPTPIGANKWLPGDYKMFIMTLRFAQDFAGGQITFETTAASGQDPRIDSGEYSAPTGETWYAPEELICDVVVAGPAQPTYAPEPTIVLTDAGVVAQAPEGYVTVLMLLNEETQEYAEVTQPYELAPAGNEAVVYHFKAYTKKNAEDNDSPEVTKDITVDALPQLGGYISIGTPTADGLFSVMYSLGDYEGPYTLTVTINGEDVEPNEDGTYTAVEGENIVTATIKADGYQDKFTARTFTFNYPVPAPAPTFAWNAETFTMEATCADHTVELYANGTKVTNPYTVEQTWEEQIINFTAQTLANDDETAPSAVVAYAENPVKVPAKELTASDAATFRMETFDTYVEIYAEGPNVVLFDEYGQEVDPQPYVVARPEYSEEAVALHFTVSATTQNDDTDEVHYKPTTTTYNVTVPVQDEPQQPEVVLPGQLIFNEVDMSGKDGGKFTVEYQGDIDGVTVEVVDMIPANRGEYQLDGYGKWLVKAKATAPGYLPLEDQAEFEWTAEYAPAATKTNEVINPADVTVTFDGSNVAVYGDPECQGEALANPYVIARPEYGAADAEEVVYVMTTADNCEPTITTFVINVPAQLPTPNVTIKEEKVSAWLPGQPEDSELENGIAYNAYIEVPAAFADQVNYRIIVNGVAGLTMEWDGQPIPLFGNEGATVVVEAWVVNGGDMSPIGDDEAVLNNNFTGVNEIANGKTVAGVRYFNMAGQEMQEANGVTIVVTTYTDGTTSAVKVMK
jgi:hypothetical protein